MTRAELRRLRAEQQRPAQGVGRFDRLERAMESIAMDVERLSDDQRLTTRLLAERQADRPSFRGPAEQRTPHQQALGSRRSALGNGVSRGDAENGNDTGSSPRLRASA
jgi:hypothetical protein